MPNIIVFGETGVGKSSVINMLKGGKDALVSDRAMGVTFSYTRHEKTIGGSAFSVFDTAGLNWESAGTVPARTTIEQLYRLMLLLDDGIHLLVYVMRAPRITQAAQQNYGLFFDIFCDKKVPIVIVLTGLEDRDDMDQWWSENKKTFDDHEMAFNGYACITATRGRLKDQSYPYLEEYEESKAKVERLIYDSYAKEPWKMPTRSRFASTVTRMRNIFSTFLGIEPKVLANELFRALRLYGDMSEREARKTASEIERRSVRERVRLSKWTRIWK